MKVPNWFQGDAKLYCVISIFLLVFVLSPPSFSQLKAKTVNWSGLQFLMGEWLGTGGGKGPGEGNGMFSFLPALQNTVIVRKNHSEYPATTTRPAYAHDDLMVMYQESDTSIRAYYFDSEGHIIHYAVHAYGDSAVFLSDAESSRPRFRLCYTKSQGETLRLMFDIAPPGKPESFSRYIEASAERKK